MQLSNWMRQEMVWKLAPACAKGLFTVVVILLSFDQMIHDAPIHMVEPVQITVNFSVHSFCICKIITRFQSCMCGVCSMLISSCKHSSVANLSVLYLLILCAHLHNPANICYQKHNCCPGEPNHTWNGLVPLQAIDQCQYHKYYGFKRHCEYG